MKLMARILIMLVYNASFADVLSLFEDVAISDAETTTLVFVAGYVGFKVQRKISCDMCKVELVSDELAIMLQTYATAYCISQPR